MIIARTLVDLVAALLTAPLWLLVLIAKPFHHSVHKRVFQFASQCVALLPGDPGNLLRRAFYRRTLDACSARCTISFMTIFSTPAASIGHGVYIGAFCSIGECTIEDDVMLGSFVSVLSGKMTHRFDRTDVPIRMQGGDTQRVTLRRDCWIGNGAIVLSDVSSGVVVGAGSVLTRTPDADSIVVGNPARMVRSRSAGASRDNASAAL